MHNSITWSVGMTLAILEKMAIEAAYLAFRYNKTATAASLGISARTLDNKLQQYEQEALIEKERQESESRKRAEFLARSRGVGQIPDNLNIIPNRANAHGAASGIRMESIANASSKPTLPVQERKEVQAVLPEHSSKNGKGRGR